MLSVFMMCTKLDRYKHCFCVKTNACSNYLENEFVDCDFFGVILSFAAFLIVFGLFMIHCICNHDVFCILSV